MCINKLVLYAGWRDRNKNINFNEMHDMHRWDPPGMDFLYHVQTNVSVRRVLFEVLAYIYIYGITIILL